MVQHGCEGLKEPLFDKRLAPLLDANGPHDGRLTDDGHQSATGLEQGQEALRDKGQATRDQDGIELSTRPAVLA